MGRTTEAWVLSAGPEKKRVPGALRLETYALPDLGPHDVLVRPLYGCWEGNMTHALERSPVDVCRQRGEARMVPGNSGAVEVVEPGSAVTGLQAGDRCIVFGNAVHDRHGYMMKALAY